MSMMPIEYKTFSASITLSKLWYAGNVSRLLLIAENLNHNSSTEIGVCKKSNSTAPSPNRDSERRICFDGKIIFNLVFQKYHSTQSNMTSVHILNHKLLWFCSGLQFPKYIEILRRFLSDYLEFQSQPFYICP